MLAFLLEGAWGLNTHTSRYFFSKRPPQKVFTVMSSLSPSVVLEEAPAIWFPISECKWGLCKTWTLDWIRLWTGLNKTAVYRQQMPPRLEQVVSISAPSCLLAVEALSSQFPKGQRSCAYLISVVLAEFLWVLKLVLTCFHCFLWKPHVLLGKHHQALIELYG